MVEQHVLRPVRARLEPSRPQLSPPARLPLLHRRLSPFQAGRDARDILPLGSGPRAGHVVSLPQGARVSDGNADAAITASGAGEDEMDASAETAGECDLLVWHHHGPELSV